MLPKLRRIRIGLRSALLIGVILPLFGLFALGGAVGLRQVERWIEGRLQEEVQLVARAIRLPLARAVQDQDRRAMREILQSVFRIHRVYGVYVYDAVGDEVAAVGSVRPTPSPARVARLTVDGDRRGEYEQIAGQSVYSYFVPLSTAGGEVAGLLHVTRLRDDFHQYFAVLRRGAGIVLLVGLVLISGVSLFGHRHVVGVHVDALRAAMMRVGDGQTDHRVAEAGPAELATVARDLNGMLDRLAAAQREALHSERERANLERRLRHTEKLAAIGRLAAGVAHEMGTPLSVIEGRARRAARRSADRQRVAQSLAAIRDEVRRLERIVRQLLDLGRAHIVRVRSTSLARLAGSAATAVQDTAAAVNVTMTLDGPAGIRAPLDPDRVERALINLLRNAIDAARDAVRLSWSQAAGETHFTVEDDGAGIPHEVRDRVVEPFFTTKQVGSGTGLGLAIAHAVADEHGGRLAIDDAAVGGARVSLIFPSAGLNA